MKEYEKLAEECRNKYPLEMQLHIDEKSDYFIKHAYIEGFLKARQMFIEKCERDFKEFSEPYDGEGIRAIGEREV
jgi:hypothetical protein